MKNNRKIPDWLSEKRSEVANPRNLKVNDEWGTHASQVRKIIGGESPVTFAVNQSQTRDPITKGNSDWVC